jgi:hypothetical protein
MERGGDDPMSDSLSHHPDLRDTARAMSQENVKTDGCPRSVNGARA